MRTSKLAAHLAPSGFIRKPATPKTYEIHEIRVEERELIYYVQAKTKRAALAMVAKGYVDESEEDVLDTNVTGRWIANVDNKE